MNVFPPSPSPPQPSEGSRRVRELTSGEQAAVAGVGTGVLALGLIGFANSFAKVAAAARPWFGPLAPTVPLGIDLGILAFSALDLVLARLDMRPKWLRLIPWGLTAATVYLNVTGEPSLVARVAHAVFPLLWVSAVEIGAHVARVRAGLAAGTAMDRIRPARWLLAPMRTVGLWRRMVLWEIRSYPAALDRERQRLLALTALQDSYGRLVWRWRAPRRARVLYRLGEHTPAGTPARTGPERTGPAGTGTPAHADQASHTAAATGRTGIPARSTPPGRVLEGRPAREGRPALPAGWVDRATVIAELADQIRDAEATGTTWRPDYEGLMASTGYRRSWCEKAVRAAREAARNPDAPPPVHQPARTGGPDPAAADGPAHTQARTGPLPIPGGEAA